MELPSLPYSIDNRLNQESVGRRASVALLAAGLALSILTTGEPVPASANNNPQVTVGMPFMGRWAFNAAVDPPYTDTNSSHPSVHNAYGYDWGTDVYTAEGTDVKLHGSSPQGTVTFRRASISDTCSSYGASIAGKGVTFDVLVNGSGVGKVKYDHLDLVDVGNDPIADGARIGVVTREPLHPTCYQARHTHIQFQNNGSTYSCYTDHGRPGESIFNEGTSLGVLGSGNTAAKQACNESSSGGSSAPNPPALGPNDPFGDIGVRRVPGGVRVSGYALDPDRAGDHSPTQVDVYYGTNGVPGEYGFGVLADQPRYDFVGNYNGATYGITHGFDTSVAMNGGTTNRFCAYGKNVGLGADRLMACRTFTANSDPIGSLDKLRRIPGGIRVEGWTLDPDVVDSTKVDVFAGDGRALWGVNPANWAPATIPRPDLAAAYPEYGDLHGYRVDVPIDSAHYGNNYVCSYFENKPQTPGAGQKVCGDITVSGDAFGSLDVFWTVGNGDIQIQGWALDPDTDESIYVDAYDEQGVGYSTVADQANPDVHSIHPGYSPNHGYNRIIHTGVGIHGLCFYAINKSGTPGTNNLIACKFVEVQ